MEYNVIKTLWSDYNNNLEKIAKTNRDILEHMISRKSERRLWVMKLQAVLGILVSPLILAVVLIPIILQYDPTTTLITGAVMFVLVLTWYFVQSIDYYNSLNQIKPGVETLVKTKKRILEIRKRVLSIEKSRYLVFPFSVATIVLIMWHDLDFQNPTKLILLGTFFIGVFFWADTNLSSISTTG